MLHDARDLVPCTQIKKIQTDLLALDITQSVQETIEPKQSVDKDAEVLKAIKQFNQLFKK
jgi:hypothetical protein